jgi:hypothetical protein
VRTPGVQSAEQLIEDTMSRYDIGVGRILVVMVDVDGVG